MAKTIDDQPKPTAKERMTKLVDSVQGSQAWSSTPRAARCTAMAGGWT